VRSPDEPGNQTTDDGFSSSRSGLNQVPVEDDTERKPGQSTRTKSREQTIKEDLDVGSYYLERKNWKAAQGRFSSAFRLDSENPDVVWGLAEAERHLQLYKDAAEHYKLFLSYEPEGRRGREARKDLEEVEAARPSASAASKVTGPDGGPQK
jgi:tetratricopeptide (TPR) repeat protein